MISTRPLSEGVVGSGQAVSEAPAPRVVPKPVPQSQEQDPRRYQIEQLKRRFSAQQSTLQNGVTLLSLKMKPSDPDFPFELDFLHCEVQLPSLYPKEPPTLRVKNTDIPRGFSVNIEKGWDRLVREHPNFTLLALTNALDKNLEAFLSEQKTETVTLVSFKDTRHLVGSGTALGDSSAPETKPEPVVSIAKSAPYVPEESYSKEQTAMAKARRAQEVRQLESRMGRLAHYQKSADGIVYTLPLEPKRRAELPAELRGVQSVQFIIPLLYPLQSLRILLNDVESKDAELLEDIFTKKATQQQQLSLMSHLNYFTQHMHVMAKEAQATAQAALDEAKAREARIASSESPEEASSAAVIVDGKAHVQVIPRPPEWTVVSGSDESEEYSGTDEDSWGSEDDDDEGGAAVPHEDVNAAADDSHVEKGTAISFPHIELHGIELFQVAILSLNVKCERCKTVNEMTGLRPGAEKSGSCKKCATALSVKFRQEIVHQNSVRAGFIDVSGCTVFDMLPSTFTPTCARCSTPSAGLVSVRGEATTNICRECHGKFTFKIPEVKFLVVTPGTSLRPSAAAAGPRRRDDNIKLGLHAGEPLPDRGACAHYRRSYRWFRFSCCGKVHACDRCHDAAEDHANEWASRMVCGWCSREQNYAVEACGFCGRSVIGRKGRGFWEGGKGTRDRARMSRKDKRKFRRVGGSEGRKKNV